MEAALIRHGADIHVTGHGGQGPLSAAAHWRLHQTLDLLIARGADVNAQDDYGKTPLMGADAYSTKALLEHGADINSVDDLEETALFHARDIETCRVLINHGANVNAVDGQGSSLLLTVQNDWHVNHLAIAQFLKQNGAHLNDKDRQVLAARNKRGRQGGTDAKEPGP
jgi:ankyrin repeat protein